MRLLCLHHFLEGVCVMALVVHEGNSQTRMNVMCLAKCDDDVDGGRLLYEFSFFSFFLIFLGPTFFFLS